MPWIDINDIFRAAPYTTGQVLREPGVGFYVPIYQREYNWDSKHIGRLFEDVGRGLELLVEDENSITFLGALIVIDRAILPNVDIIDPPGNVRIVIDGQQRLTTILLMNICLHDEIRRRGVKFNIENKPAFQWLYNMTIDVKDQLKKTFAADMDQGDGVYQWYPRIIREHDDLWSRSREKAIYKSPIAAFIHGYLKHIQGTDKTKQYKGDIDQIDRNSALLKKYRVIRRKIKSAWKGDGQDLEMPLLGKVAESSIFQNAIFQAEFPEEVRFILSNEGSEDFKQLIRLVSLATFLMEGATVTVLLVKKEDYAFDMFESLNTTGEPLTAFETFKPKVIDAEGLDEYENSPSRKFMKPIEEYMEQFKDAQKRHTEASRLLIPFALAETGEKLSTRHSDQRKYLRDQYDKLQDDTLRDKEPQRKLVQHLSHTASFFTDAWKQEENAFQSIAFPNKNLVLMCMDVLGKVNHDIAIGPLVRFYAQIQLASSDSRAGFVNELEDAIKAITAFFAFWRGIGKTTGDLADQYRELMKKGFDQHGGQPQAFCRCPEDRKTLENLTAQKLQEALKYALKDRGGITSKDDWVRLSFKQSVYKDRKTLARFLLFAAMHNTSEDKENLGLRLAAREGVLNMLTWEKWQEDLTIEHVAPQDPEEDSWPKWFHEGSELVHNLGNLTLLPQAENTSSGRRPWEEKKEIYRVMSSSTPKEVEARLTEAENRGIRLNESTKALLRNGRYFPHLSAICKVEDWDNKFVQKRSKRLAKLVWTNIAPWLGFDDE